MKQFTVLLFLLSDGKLAMQRRTDDAPYAPGKLGLFGGWLEGDESPTECAVRELKEETSLDPVSVGLTYVQDIVVPASDDFPEDRHFYVFTGTVPDLNFEVYEGVGVEAHDVSALVIRPDLAGAAKYILPRVIESVRKVAGSE